MINRQETNEYIHDASWTFWKIFWRVVLIIIVVSAVGFGIHWLFTPAALVSKVANPDAIVNNYENFQEIYNTCQKLDADLHTICQTPSDDPMFTNFSKGAMVAAKRQQMTRWVQEYNANSKMITRQMWKSPRLPYQINQEDFPNYNCNK